SRWRKRSPGAWAVTPASFKSSGPPSISPSSGATSPWACRGWRTLRLGAPGTPSPSPTSSFANSWPCGPRTEAGFPTSRRCAAFVIHPEAVAFVRYVGVLASADSALRDSLDVVLRAAMRDGTLERIFRRWNVWDPRQGELFRSVAGEGGTPPSEATRSGAGSVWAYLPSLGRAAVVTAVLSFLSMTLAVGVGLLVASGLVYGPA